MSLPETVISPATVRLPPLDRDIFSEAASLAAVLKLSFVALLSAAKSPSETAAIPAATKMASVPVPSSGAWKLITPMTSSAAMSVQGKTCVCYMTKRDFFVTTKVNHRRIRQ